MLELSSNTIKVLGIFGRLSPEQEEFFDGIEQKFSKKPGGDEYDIFRHLTLTFIPNASIPDARSQLDLLKNLKKFLPLKVKIKKFFTKDEESLPGAEHIAAEFELSETQEIVDYVQQHCPDMFVATWYTKVVWFVPKENQALVMKELSDVKELEFTDFYLVSNKQNEANTLYTSQAFGS